MSDVRCLIIQQTALSTAEIGSEMGSRQSCRHESLLFEQQQVFRVFTDADDRLGTRRATQGNLCNHNITTEAQQTSRYALAATTSTVRSGAASKHGGGE